MTNLKHAEILREIERLGEAIKAAEARENELVESYMMVCDLKERPEARGTVENEILENIKHRKNLERTRELLKNSAKIALLNEVPQADNHQ